MFSDQGQGQTTLKLLDILLLIHIKIMSLRERMHWTVQVCQSCNQVHCIVLLFWRLLDFDHYHYHHIYHCHLNSIKID